MLNRRPLDPKKLAPFQRGEEPPRSLSSGSVAHKKTGSSEPLIQGAPAAKRAAVPSSRKMGTAPAKAMAAATAAAKQKNVALLNDRYVCDIICKGSPFTASLVCLFSVLFLQQVVEQVGAGANGVVVRALDARTGGVVAIKSIKTVCLSSHFHHMSCPSLT